MAQETKMVPCSKCGIPVRVQGIGPHEAKCTGDPERTKALERRRERTRRTADQKRHDGLSRKASGVDLASMTWEQLVELLRGVKAEIKSRYGAAKRL